MPVTGATIRTALAAVGAVGKQIRSFDELAAGADDALQQAPPGLTASGAASFLATCAQESAYFRTTREYGSGQWYAPWIGRGFVQCTHKANYAAFGKWARSRGLVTDANIFINNRAALEDYRYAWATAVWYFEANNLWGWANAGDHLRTQQAVNGGRGRAGTSFVPNHWAERKKMYDAFLRADDTLLPATSTTVSAASTAVTTPAGPPPEGESVYVRTPMPPTDEQGNITSPKWEWPTERIILPFEPDTGFLKVDHGGVGGWIHLGRWWVRRRDWTPNQPFHDPQDHPMNAPGARVGSERFVGYGWRTGAPAGADKIELVLSAPHGAVVQWWRTK